MWVDPIIDRTAADILNRTDKAFFNVADWLRIYGNAAIVAALINLVYGAGIEFEHLPEPSMITIPTAADLNHFLEVINVEQWKGIVGISAGYGLTTIKTDYLEGVSGNSPDYNAVNGWERNIQILHDYIMRQIHYQVMCGVASAGQARFWQVRFRTYGFVEGSASPSRIPRTGAARSGTGLMRQNGFRRY